MFLKKTIFISLINFIFFLQSAARYGTQQLSRYTAREVPQRGITTKPVSSFQKVVQPASLSTMRLIKIPERAFSHQKGLAKESKIIAKPAETFFEEPLTLEHPEADLEEQLPIRTIIIGASALGFLMREAIKYINEWYGQDTEESNDKIENIVYLEKYFPELNELLVEFVLKQLNIPPARFLGKTPEEIGQKISEESRQKFFERYADLATKGIHQIIAYTRMRYELDSTTSDKEIIEKGYAQKAFSNLDYLFSIINILNNKHLDIGAKIDKTILFWQWIESGLTIFDFIKTIPNPTYESNAMQQWKTSWKTWAQYKYLSYRYGKDKADQWMHNKLIALFPFSQEYLLDKAYHYFQPKKGEIEEFKFTPAGELAQANIERATENFIKNFYGYSKEGKQRILALKYVQHKIPQLNDEILKQLFNSIGFSTQDISKGKEDIFNALSNDKKIEVYKKYSDITEKVLQKLVDHAHYFLPRMSVQKIIENNYPKYVFRHILMDKVFSPLATTTRGAPISALEHFEKWIESGKSIEDYIKAVYYDVNSFYRKDERQAAIRFNQMKDWIINDYGLAMIFEYHNHNFNREKFK